MYSIVYIFCWLCEWMSVPVQCVNWDVNSFAATGDYSRPRTSAIGDYSRPVPLAAVGDGRILLTKKLNFTAIKVWHPQVEIWQRKS